MSNKKHHSHSHSSNHTIGPKHGDTVDEMKPLKVGEWRLWGTNIGNLEPCFITKIVYLNDDWFVFTKSGYLTGKVREVYNEIDHFLEMTTSVPPAWNEGEL